MKPPKCKTCGKEEWRHTCCGLPYSGGVLNASFNKVGDGATLHSAQQPHGEKTKRAEPHREAIERVPVPPSAVVAIEARAAKRKEYLKLKARERRARQKAEKGKS